MAILSPGYLASAFSLPLHSHTSKFLQWAMLVSVHAAASSPRTWGPILVHRSANLYSSNIFSRAQFCRHFLWVKLSCLAPGELDGVPKHILPTATYTYPVIALTTLYWDYGFNWESFSLQASHITFITAWPFQQRKSLHAPKPLPLLTHQVLPGPQHPTSFYTCSTIP